MTAPTQSCTADFTTTPGIPRDGDGVVFAAPWEAKAFALVVQLHQQGCFEWAEWVATFSSEIAADRDRANPTPYYALWLSAAEQLIARKALVSREALGQRREQLRAEQAHAAQGHDHDHDHDHDH